MMDVQNEYVAIELKEGILIVRYLPKKIDLKAAKLIVAARKAFSGNRSLPGLADTRKITSVTRDAREYLSSAEAIEGVVAGAILSGSSFNAFIANFFVKVTKPRIPTRIFTREQDALKWLEQYKK